MRASILVKELLILIERHGDQEVYIKEEDYPGRVGSSRVVTEADGYLHKVCFEIMTEDSE